MTPTAYHQIIPRYRTSGWVISFATHAIGIGIIVFFLSGIHLVSAPEPFRWDVSVTQAPAHVTKAEAVEAKQAPLKPVKKMLPKRAEMNSAAPTERRVVESRPISRPIQSQAPVITRESEPAKLAVEAEVIPKETIRHQTAVTSEADSISKTAETHMVETKPVPTEENIVALSPAIAQQNVTAESHEHSVVTQQVVEHSAVSTVVEQSPIVERVLEAQSVEAASVPVETTTIQTRQDTESLIGQPKVENRHIQTDEAVASHSSSTVQQSADGKPSALHDLQPSLKNNPLHSNQGTRTDYGWLREALWNRIERLKGYPYIARTNRWEGLVILEAIINNDGQLVDVKVVES
ncbi:MAG: putative TonB protein, partial [Nitrospira sp.]|nr:putative TonB protein [Nitrospira sp.]